jgi:nitric-oxide synthase
MTDDADRCRRRKEKHRTLAQKLTGLASCYGCGSPMLTTAEAALGYYASC